MINRIKQLETLALPLEPDAQGRARLLESILAYGDAFLEALPDLPAYEANDAGGRALYDAPILDEGADLQTLLDLLKQHVDRAGLNSASAGHLGFIPGGGLYHAALGDYLAAVTNRYAGVFFASPGAVRMENMLLRWMGGIVGYPDTLAGNLTSGGSLANLIGIVTARDAHGLQAEAIRQAVVYMTAHVHHSVDKALRIAGLRGCVKRIIRVDNHYRMNANALAEAIAQDKQAGWQPWLVVASAGTTNTGSVDPLLDIGQISQAEGLWLHVDGAYGAFFALTEMGRAVLKGLELSDSIVMDPHKTLFLPWGSGAVLVKDRQKLLEAHHYGADYMQDTLALAEELSPADCSPELTKPFRGLRLWLPLKLLGVAPFRAALEEKLLLARTFYDRIQAIDGFEVGPYPDLSVVTYRYVPRRGDADAFNRQIIKHIHQEGRVFLTSTMVDDKFVLRLAVGSFRTHLDTIELALDRLAQAVKVLGESG